MTGRSPLNGCTGIALLFVVGLLCAACIPERQTTDDAADDPCHGIDPVLASSAFVTVAEPRPGERVTVPLIVTGCSRTNEANVIWRLHGRDGSLLSSGYTSGGGLAGPEEFRIEVLYTLSAREIGLLEVAQPDESDGEGYPPIRVVMPLVLSATNQSQYSKNNSPNSSASEMIKLHTVDRDHENPDFTLPGETP